ncbi:hypothetical protein [Vibrio sp. MACH09]|uniref:hypothetical protein n=1 Tax=Vibrio sp. MACH09 TaxID=3025122 RepID=UPI00295E245D|nr:hypothetical protein [Vibrio sp. MACH09]
MERVGKLTNDSGFIKHFIHNSYCKTSDYHGRYVVVTEDALMIPDECYLLHAVELDRAVQHLCEQGEREAAKAVIRSCFAEGVK